jgi:hypothetical protein
MAQADSVPTPIQAPITGATSKASTKRRSADRRYFIGGSDARIIMGNDETALLRLWREKRGEVEPEDLSGNLVVQLGLATEDLNRRWYQTNSSHVLTDIQRQIRHPALRWMAATLDGRVEATGAVFEAKFMLPWAFSEEAAAEKYMPQLQHNMWVVAARSAVLSVITGGGKWVEIQHLIVTAERKFWRCVESGEPSRGSVRLQLIRYSVLQASTRSTAVLVKQFDASCFKSTADGGGVCESHCRPSVAGFCTIDC